MYDHIGLKVGNLDASVRFYTAALKPLGYVMCSRDDSGAGFGPKGEPALWLYLSKDAGLGVKNVGAHVAFRAPDGPPVRGHVLHVARAVVPDDVDELMDVDLGVHGGRSYASLSRASSA